MVQFNHWKTLRGIATAIVVVAGVVAIGQGQNPPSEPSPVVIRREPLRLTPPETYRFAFQLEPIKQLVHRTL